MTGAIVPLTRVGMRYLPAMGRGLGTLMTYLGVDAAMDFVADLVTSTGRPDWSIDNFVDKFGEVVGNHPGRAIPIAEAAIRACGSDKVLDMMENIDTSDFDSDEKNQVKDLIKVLRSTENSIERVTGDGDDDTVWGIDKRDYQKQRISDKIAMGYVKTLISFFGSTTDIRALREALFKVEDEHFDLYDDMSEVIHG